METNNNFVDLSKLPKRNNGNYNWEKSIGMSFPFFYNGINGDIVVLNYNKSTCKVTIYIKDYTCNSGTTIYNSQMANCILGKILKPKIAATHPNIVPYLKDPDDAFRYSSGSAKKVCVICPNCGYIKMMAVYSLVAYGMSCDVCGDGVSYPNKFMRAIFTQLNINFIPELSKKHSGFEWAQNYRYDFYFEKDNKKYIVEMDGDFHYKDCFGQIKYMHDSDVDKDILANQHGIYIIRIDCNYNNLDRFTYIKNSILNSELCDLLNLNNQDIDWLYCDLCATRTLINDICTLWNSNQFNTNDIANKLKIARVTVCGYLRKGAMLGLTDYDGKDVRSKKRAEINKIIARNNKKPIAIYKDNILIGVFASCSDLSKQSMGLFNKKFDDTVLSKAAKGDIKYAYGYTIQRISKEEFEKYIVDHNNMFIVGGDYLGLAI